MILGPTRIASATANLGDGQVDWVLHPFAHYYSPSPANTLITTTNQTSLLQIPFASVIDAVGIGGWLGSSYGYVLGVNTCFNWSENTTITTGFMFRTQYTDNTFFERACVSFYKQLATKSINSFESWIRPVLSVPIVSLIQYEIDR